MAVPTWATVNITATPVQVTVGGDVVDTDEIVISYEIVASSNDVRAFAFDVTVQDPCGDPCSDAHIVGINEADLNVDYWVYPGSIDINEAGEVNDVGTPIADPCFVPVDTQGGLGTAGITIEMASLYVGESNAPATSGVLLKFVVDDNCLVKMSKNVSRGGVVMEGGGVPSGGTAIFVDTTVNMYNGTDIGRWRLAGRPKCWCRFKGGRQCRGDVDGKGQGIGKNRWVSTHDTEVYRTAYNKTTASFPPGKTWADTTVRDLNPGCTAAVCDVLLVCADTDHGGAGLGQKKRVYVNDTPPFRLQAFGGNYNKTVLAQDCPPGSP